MGITDLIGPDRVMAAMPSSDKPALLRELSQRAARQLAIEDDYILSALQARERLGSTGVGGGIAMPHACIPGVPRFFGLFAQLERPIAFDAIDDRPVDLIFLLLTPDQAGREHLTALALISRRLRDPRIAQCLRAAKTAAEIYNILIGPEPKGPPLRCSAAC